MTAPGPSPLDRLTELARQMTDEGHPLLLGDRLLTARQNLYFLDDARFQRAVTDSVTHPWQSTVQWRLHTILWAASHAVQQPGAFLQCGVWYGFYPAAIVSYLGDALQNTPFHLYDSFEGIPPEYDSHHRDNIAYHEPDLYEHAQQRFANTPNVHVIRGWLPDAFTNTCPDQIAFCHLNLDSAIAEIACLRYVWPRLRPGAIAISEGYLYYPEYRDLFRRDGVLEELGITLLELPTGQGLIIKR